MTKAIRFTAKTLEDLKPPSSGRDYYQDTHPKANGLRLACLSSGVKSFFIQATVGGKTKRITIGRSPDMKVPRAREKALEKLGIVAEDIDPIEQKRVERAEKAVTGLTVEQAVDTYLENKRTGKQKLPLKEGTKKDYKYSIKRLLGDDYWQGPFADITEEVIAKRVALKEKGSKAKTAGGCRSLSAVWNWTRRQKENRGLVPENPVALYAQDIDGLYVAPKKTSWVQPEYLKEWFDSVEGLDDVVMQEFFEFLLLTGCRLNEVTSLTWPQLNFKTNTYKLIDTKNREDVELPIPKYLRDKLHARKKRKGIVFPVPDGAQKTRAALGKEMGLLWTNHDLRRTFAKFGYKVTDHIKVKALMHHIISDITWDYGNIDATELAHELEKIEKAILSAGGRIKRKKEDNVVYMDGGK